MLNGCHGDLYYCITSKSVTHTMLTVHCKNACRFKWWMAIWCFGTIIQLLRCSSCIVIIIVLCRTVTEILVRWKFGPPDHYFRTIIFRSVCGIMVRAQICWSKHFNDTCLCQSICIVSKSLKKLFGKQNKLLKLLNSCWNTGWCALIRTIGWLTRLATTTA